MRKLWLLFSQTATICLAALFVVATLRPDLLNNMPQNAVITVRQHADSAAGVTRAGSYSDAAKKAMPAVVNIYTSQAVKSRPRHPIFDDPVFRHFFGDPGEAQAQPSTNLGSGVIVSSSGYILTNSHVIEAADGIEVALADTRRVIAKVVGTDPESDLAVLKIDLPNLPSITFGASDTAKVGDVVLAIGNPFGVGQTVTMGIVSALGRTHLGINTFENFIQTDAAINPGNSGGALIDTNGNLLGINTAIYSKTGTSLGIGFSIPASTAKSVMEQIIQNGSVQRGWIGVGVQDMTREIAESFKTPEIRGALITEVFRGTPADRGGIRVGDVLVAVDGQPVTDSGSMLNLIAALKPGSEATLKLVRAAKPLEIRVTVGKRPPKKTQQE
ncbi:MAG: Do family serine endopeptidase [Burkholderiales bacterium]|nr:Do family serine endopeptidase [Burkholderiales bacterium]